MDHSLHQPSLACLPKRGCLNTKHRHPPMYSWKAENVDQTVKRLFKKFKTARESEFLALLDWRNTLTAGIGTSPAQRLFGRRCRTPLPVAISVLQRSYPTEEDTRKLIGNKQRQKFYYNKHSKTSNSRIKKNRNLFHLKDP